MTSTTIVINLAFLMAHPTGTGNYALNLLPHLQDLSSVLLTRHSIADYCCYLTPSGLTSEHGLLGHIARLYWTQFQLPQLYHSLHSQLLFTPIPEAPLFTRCRYIVTIHDLIPLRFSRRFSALRNYNRYYVPQVLEQAVHVLCNSDATANDLIQFFQLPSQKITPIPLACDRQHFQFANQPTCNYFLYLGRHDPHKNPRRLIAAFSTLPDCRNYQLWLVGSTDSRYTPQLKTQARELGIADQVKFLDYVAYQDLPGLIQGAIALVFPSLWEGFGLPVLEAMACGTPVITSNLSALPEVAGDAAILIDPYRVEAIADAMAMVAADAQLRSKLRQLGLARASQFSWQKTGEATAAVLRRFL